MSINDCVQITICRTDLTVPPAADLFELLDEGERRRAQRLPCHASFITARAMVRVILGRHLGVLPADVSIDKGPHGKPVLKEGVPHFSLSHTQGMIAVAVREAGPVGIDVETTERKPPQPGMLQRTLTETELQTLEGQSLGSVRSAFLQVWSRKEAYAKGLGVGLGLDFQVIQAGWDDIAIAGNPSWELRSLALPPPYVGAIAAQGQGWHLRTGGFEW